MRGSSHPMIRRGRWAATAVAAALVSLLLAGLTTVGLHRFGGRTAADASAGVVEIHSVHGASFVPALQGKRPLFILALGSDARPGQRVDRQRADAIHLIGIDTAHHRATILDIPRDSWVPIPGVGTAKINTAMVAGGPALEARTVENLTGIRIDFWMLTSFPGLINMVNGIGGLTVRVLQPMHDPNDTGANFSVGVRHFSGAQALAYARDRHNFANGDLTRTANHGRLLLAALTRLHQVFANDPAQLLAWIAVGWHNIQTDLSPDTLLALALTATQVPVKNVNNVVLPATTGNVGPQSVVFILSAAQGVYKDMRSDGIVGR